MIENNTQIKVRYAETDQMGVVHHANYALYLELARIEWLSMLGFSYAEMEKQGVILPVVSLLVNRMFKWFVG
jgi:acyl-CoA thioester hydrolase